MRSWVSTMITATGRSSAEQSGGVDPVRGAEPLDAAQHGRAGQAGLVCSVDDLGEDRLVVPLVGLAAQDRESKGGPLESHRILQSTSLTLLTKFLVACAVAQTATSAVVAVPAR
jgi:hypothetical protein